MRPTSDKGDICPSKIVIANSEIFAPFFTRTINASFRHNTVPKALKKVWVTPIAKKPNANLEDPVNLRPITNVMFLLKMIDKMANDQFQKHLADNNLLHCRQSGFRAGHSTETALLDLQTEMRRMMERGKVGLLVLLDLSAAFDLVDHQILTHHLAQVALCDPDTVTWFQSFLSDRESKVCWESAESAPENLLFGVPQGSCLSPSLFNVYITPLFNTLQKNNIFFTNYADDTQLLLELSGDHQADTLSVNATYATVKNWMDAHWMCLNSNKTELMLIGLRHSLLKLDAAYNTITIDNNVIPVANKVKTLGVTLDSSLTMTQHTRQISKNCQYFLKLIRQIRPLLSEAHATAITRALILPRIDYCNVLLSGTSTDNITRLQTVQNEAVRIIAKIARRDHISEARRNLHWLPVKDRITFKLVMITHKCLAGNAPAYLTQTIQPLAHNRHLRSLGTGQLQCPRFTKLNGLGKAFPCTAPRKWNSLPKDLRMEKSATILKKDLKTLLFN